VASGVAHDPVRGEVYWVDLDPARGSEQAGRRPAVVISANFVNRALQVVTVAAITSKVKNRSSRVQVILPPGQPLKQESSILAFQVVSIDKSRLDGFVGVLTPPQIIQLNQALRAAWDI
jgi:mRNA interferase MazF